MPERLGWVGYNLESAKRPHRENSLLEIGVWVSESAEPFDFLGAVGYCVAPQVADVDALPLSAEDRQRHEDSGLLEALRHGGIAKSPADVEEEIIELMYRYGEPGHYTLAGRGCSYTRQVMKQFTPDLYKMFSEDDLDLNGFSQVVKYSDVTGDYEHSDEFTVPPRAIHEAEFYYREFLHYQEMLLQGASGAP